MTDLLCSAVRYQWQWIHTYLPPPSPQSNEIYSHLVLFLFGGKSSPLMTLDPIERSSLMKIGVWLRLQRGYCVNMQTLEGKLYKICFKYTHTHTGSNFTLKLLQHCFFHSVILHHHSNGGDCGETVYLRTWNEERKKAVVTQPAEGRGVQCR